MYFTFFFVSFLFFSGCHNFAECCVKDTFHNTLIKFSIDEVGDFSMQQHVDGCISPVIVNAKVTIIECYNQTLGVLKEGAIVDMPELYKLVLTGNRISRIKFGAFTNLPKLEDVDLTNNDIKIIEVGVFSVVPSVSRIRLHNNDLSFLDEGIFTSMSNLWTLILSSNQLDNIDHEWFDLESNLRVLHMSHNKIRKVPKNAFVRTKKLEIVDISNNEIVTIGEEAFNGLDDLIILDLSNNRIYQLTGNLFKPLKQLYTLYLHGNNLTYIHSKVLHDISLTLKELSIFSNPWQCACYDYIYAWARGYQGLKIDQFLNCVIEYNPVCVFPFTNANECLEDSDEDLGKRFYEQFTYNKEDCKILSAY